MTGNLFSESFYVGNALGSFNSWMRLITGLLFGLGMVWLVYPLIEVSLRDVRQPDATAADACASTVTDVT